MTTRPTRLCVLCGAEMVLGRNWVAQRPFLRCSTYPECAYKEEPVPAYFEMLSDKRAARLPGLEEG